MSTFNAIWIGHAFSQDFDFDPGAIPDAAVLWLPLREAAPRGELRFARLDLARISPTRFRLSLTAEQTGTLRVGPHSGDFRLELAGSNTVLGLRLIVPVELAQ